MSSGYVRIWDAWVRLFQWSRALAVGFQLFSGETSWQFFHWQRPVGEFILALRVFRIMWGLVGSSNASLCSLVHSPRSALEHLAALFRRNLQSGRGHNAAGGWAVLTMLVLLPTQGVTGFFIADEDEFIEGAL
jgi:cytochrome b